MEEMNSLKDIINIKCEMYKDRVAFMEKNPKTRVFEDITYSKVREDVNGLGTIMLEKLKLKDKKIAVIGENSYRWYVTYMAVACGVGIIVPLDKELPANEIVNLLKRSEASAIVYSSRKKDVIEEIKKELPKNMVYIEMNKEESDKNAYSFDKLVEGGKELVDTGNTEYIDMEIDREEFKILLFTSGTTAESKGVMLNHRNLCADNVACYCLVPKMHDYTYLSVLPMHHTYEFSTVYIYGTSCGAKIAICEGLKYIEKNLKEVKPDCMAVVPAIIEKINKKIEKGIKNGGKEALVKTMGKVTNGLSKIGVDLRYKAFKEIHENFGGNLKHIFCGAAPLDIEIIKKMETYGFWIYQGYGLTEASPLIASGTHENRVAGTVGKPAHGVEVRIDLSANEDENSNVGEIIAKGDNIMMGYYKNEAETKKVLKKGWFYTGDLGYFDLKGNLVISGRSKNVIVTSNGKNIYPEEIEFEINKIPLVEETMIYGKKDKNKKNELVITARVTLDEEYIKEKYGANRPSEEEIYNEIWQGIKAVNKTMVTYKAVKELEIKKDAFEKTTTMKIKRFAELNKKK